MAQYKGTASEAGCAMHLMKTREKQRKQMEQMKQRTAAENIKSKGGKKFSTHYDAVEVELKSSAVSLVALNDLQTKQEALVKEREKQLAKEERSKQLQLKLDKLREKEHKEAKRKISGLSFTLEQEQGVIYEEEPEMERVTTKRRKLGKNPEVHMSFLPDRERDEQENWLREVFRQEWEAKQAKIESEETEITFGSWDGSGHRHTVKMKKGDTMQQLLQSH